MTQDPYRNPAPPIGLPADAGDVQFDRAEAAAPPSPGAVAGFQAPPAATACAVCGRPLTDAYYEAGGKIVCPQCQQMILASHTGGSGFVRFVKAAVVGFVAGVV